MSELVAPIGANGAPRGGVAEQLWDAYFDEELRTKLYPVEVVRELRTTFLTGIWTMSEYFKKIMDSPHLKDRQRVAFLKDLDAELRAKILKPKKDPLFGGVV